MPNKNQFIVEIDGITRIEATKVDGLEAFKHTPSKLNTGNRNRAIYGPGNYEVGVVTVNHAEAFGQTAREVFEWHRNYHKRIDLGKRNARVIQLDDDGATPAAEYLLTECVPVDYKHDGLDATSSDPGFITFSFQPDDSQRF